MNYIVHVIGPDDVLEFDSELDASRHASDYFNRNKCCDDRVYLIALVYTEEEYKKAKNQGGGVRDD